MEDTKNRLESNILQNDVLKRQIKDLEMQLEIANAKINVKYFRVFCRKNATLLTKSIFLYFQSLNEQKTEKEKEFHAYQEKIEQIEKREEVNLNELKSLNNVSLNNKF